MGGIIFLKKNEGSNITYLPKNFFFKKSAVSSNCYVHLWKLMHHLLRRPRSSKVLLFLWYLWLNLFFVQRSLNYMAVLWKPYLEKKRNFCVWESVLSHSNPYMLCSNLNSILHWHHYKYHNNRSKILHISTRVQGHEWTRHIFACIFHQQ